MDAKNECHRPELISTMFHYGRTRLSKYITGAIVVIFVVCTTVFFSISYKRLTPTLTFSAVFEHNEVPLNDGDIYVDDSVAKQLFDEVQIYCWILTTKTGVVTKAAGVNFTWAPRCNKHVFFSSAFGDETTLPPLPGMPEPTPGPKIEFDLSAGKRQEFTAANGNKFATITMGDVLFIDTPEGYQNLTEKSREVIEYLYLSELNNYAWFLKADDDTYMVMENLRYLLKGLDVNKPTYLGYQLEPTWYDSAYMSGGAGYVFNSAGLKLLVENGLKKTGTCQEKGSFEDLEVGRCALKAGVHIISSLDQFERETFHPDKIHDYIPGPPPQWLYYYSRNKPKGGSECCSQLTVSFHRMSTQDMLIFDHLLYKTTVYGRRVTGSFQNFFKHGVVKQLPNGIPTMKTL